MSASPFIQRIRYVGLVLWAGIPWLDLSAVPLNSAQIDVALGSPGLEWTIDSPFPELIKSVPGGLEIIYGYGGGSGGGPIPAGVRTIVTGPIVLSGTLTFDWGFALNFGSGGISIRKDGVEVQSVSLQNGSKEERPPRTSPFSIQLPAGRWEMFIGMPRESGGGGSLVTTVTGFTLKPPPEPPFTQSGALVPQFAEVNVAVAATDGLTSLRVDNLPDWLVLDRSHVLRGIADATGTFTLDVTAEKGGVLKVQPLKLVVGLGRLRAGDADPMQKVGGEPYNLELGVRGPGLLRYTLNNGAYAVWSPASVTVPAATVVSVEPGSFPVVTNYLLAVGHEDKALTWRASSSPVGGYANSVQGYFFLSDMSFASPSTFTDWAASLPDGQRGPNDDPDGDGMENLIEYASDHLPLQSTPIDPLTVLNAADGNLEVFLARRAGSPDVEITPEVSTGDGVWMTAPEAGGLVRQGAHFVRLSLPATNGTRLVRWHVALKEGN